MGNWSHASMCGVGMVDMKLFREDRVTKERATNPYYELESC
jgi:hypothetical protein